MRWFFYNILFTIAYLIMLPNLFIRMKRRGGYRANFQERFGKYSPDVETRLGEKKRIWIHAVSVGEANLAGNIISELRCHIKDVSFVISTTSSTGRAVCEKLAQKDDVVIYLPIDFPRNVKRALKKINFDTFILVESEFWPNLIRAMNSIGKKIFLVNGRVSDKTAPNYKRLKCFFRPIFECFTLMLVQGELDKERLIAAGAPANKIKIMGSAKFDIKPIEEERIDQARANCEQSGIMASDIVVLGGSTWPGEEISIAKAWKNIANPNVKLILVPRHMERGDEVEQELATIGLKTIRRSRVKQGTETITPAEDVILMVDTTGELSALYGCSDIVIVGRSFDPNFGGQNMIEPAAMGKPVIVGPHTENFVPVMNCFKEQNAIIILDDVSKLEETLRELIASADKRMKFGLAGEKVVDSQRGSLTRSAIEILANI